MIGGIDINALTLEQYFRMIDENHASGMNKTSEYPYYIDDAKIETYYDLPPLLPCFTPIQPYTQCKNESYKIKLDEENNYMSDEESVMSEQGTTDNTNAPDAPKLEPHDEGMSSDDDVDEWFVTEMEEHTKGGKQGRHND
uniref:Uncharacterized protein n=1 Tax=Tanacetum cinerariifolium TaxID=118510 RepID=A0A699J892_TANCI|nr:hypothetical protein [Tanacetum cinerariifolium]